MKKNISILCLIFISLSCICGCGAKKEETKKEDNLQQGADMSQVEIFGVEPKTVETTTTAPVETEAPNTTTTQPKVTASAPVTTAPTQPETKTLYIGDTNKYFNIGDTINYSSPNDNFVRFTFKINSITNTTDPNTGVKSIKINFDFTQYFNAEHNAKYINFYCFNSSSTLKQNYSFNKGLYAENLPLREKHNLEYNIGFDSIDGEFMLAFRYLKINSNMPIVFKLNYNDIK